MSEKLEIFLIKANQMLAKYLRWLLCLMAGTWISAICYGIAQKISFWELVPISLLSAALILMAGSILFFIPLIIVWVAGLIRHWIVSQRGRKE